MTPIEKRIPITRMDCPTCIPTLEKAVSGLDGVLEVKGNYFYKYLKVVYDPEKVTLESVEEAIEGVGYQVAYKEYPSAVSRIINLFRKGEPDSAVVVGYCGMAEPHCDLCWEQSIQWQTALFDYMSQGWTVRDAFDQAGADYPACGDSNCVRFAGDVDFAVVPEVRRDPWSPSVVVTQPNGGETVEFGTVYEVTWHATDNGVIDSIAILLSLDGGLTYPDTVATGEPNDSSYLWVVPDVDSKSARIKIVATDCAMNYGDDLSDSDFVLWGSVSGIESPEMPKAVAGPVLEITGGNPIGTGSTIVFGIPCPGRIHLAIYDVSGRRLADLVKGYFEEGYHAVGWSGQGHDGSRLSPGIYFLRLKTEKGCRMAKAVVAG